MWILSLALFIAMYIEAAGQEAQEKALIQHAEYRYEQRRKGKERFKEQYGAGDEMVRDALYQESHMTPLADEIRLRLYDEAGVVISKEERSLIKLCHLIALGILAQSGKIPDDFIDYGINWSLECVEYRGGKMRSSPTAAATIERFIRWYDKELENHGVTERLMNKRIQADRVDTLVENRFAKDVVYINEEETIPFRSILFWPSTKDNYSGRASLRTISLRLIK